MKQAAVPFALRWRRISAQRGPLCVGVAPSTKWLTAWGLPENVDGARDYCRTVLDAAGDSLGAYKVQVPFFERFGPDGLRLLRWFVDEAHARGCVVVLDAKRGDADDTMSALAETYLGPDSHLGGDALTANAFMGFDTLAPLLQAADRTGSAVFLMVRTSNHAATTAQVASTPDGLSVAQHLADAVTTWNTRVAGPGVVGPVGAVVGARLPESADLLARLRTAVVEVPGLGRSDRDPDEVLAPCVGHLPNQALLTVTAGLLVHGPDQASLRRALHGWQAEVSQRVAALADMHSVAVAA